MFVIKIFLYDFSEEIGFDSQFLEDPEFNNVLEDLLAGEKWECEKKKREGRENKADESCSGNLGGYCD